MSDTFVNYRKAVEWFEQGKTIRERLSKEEAELEAKETEWRTERLERRGKIDGIKHQIQDNYGNRVCIKRNKKIISSYKTHMASEEEMMKKMEYATKCLVFIKNEMIEDAGRVTDQEPDINGLKECEVEDDLSRTIKKLSRFLEGWGEEDEIDLEHGGDEPIYLPAQALYAGGSGKFIEKGSDGIVEENFPSIFDLKREGFSPDDVIGLAHLQFIGGIRDEEEINFEWVGESKDWGGRYVEGYSGVSFPPNYFLNNENEGREDGMDWRDGIQSEKPAKMYIGSYGSCEPISSMEDIFTDGRLYNNRFGIRYDSKPERVYWEYEREEDN
jgi:hypothetical protein